LIRIPSIIQEVKFVTLRGLAEFIGTGPIIKISNVFALYGPMETRIIANAARL